MYFTNERASVEIILLVSEIVVVFAGYLYPFADPNEETLPTEPLAWSTMLNTLLDVVVSSKIQFKIKVSAFIFASPLLLSGCFSGKNRPILSADLACSFISLFSR